MLASFIASNRGTIIAHASARVSARSFRASEVTLADGVPAFLDQLCDALHVARSSGEIDHAQIQRSASRHGKDLLRLGLTVGQVVQCYGDVCQVVMDLASLQQATIPPEEFQTMNLCIDDAIANAVTEYSRGRESAIEGQGTERLGVLAHELRNALNTAFLSYDIIKSGKVAVGGSTGLVLGRSLMDLRNLIDRSLADVRLDAGIRQRERIGVSDFLGEVQIGASLQAEARSVKLLVAPIDSDVTMAGDRQILAAALANLLQNAFKFTRRGTLVSLITRVTPTLVSFDVADQCGGLPAGKAAELFRPFEQRGGDRTGVGLGLAICLKAARASAGTLEARDVPGHGCVFTLALPRSEAADRREAAGPGANG